MKRGRTELSRRVHLRQQHGACALVNNSRDSVYTAEDIMNQARGNTDTKAARGI